MRFRSSISAADIENVGKILDSTGFFYDFEIKIAKEMVEETLKNGPVIGYNYLFIEDEEGRPVGFSCFGEIPLSPRRYDLYWLCVSNSLRGSGIGKQLLRATEDTVREMGGKILYIETSGRELYAPTNAFYRKKGYLLEAVLKDYYADNDDKMVYSKRL